MPARKLRSRCGFDLDGGRGEVGRWFPHDSICWSNQGAANTPRRWENRKHADACKDGTPFSDSTPIYLEHITPALVATRRDKKWKCQILADCPRRSCESTGNFRCECITLVSTKIWCRLDFGRVTPAPAGRFTFPVANCKKKHRSKEGRRDEDCRRSAGKNYRRRAEGEVDREHNPTFPSRWKAPAPTMRFGREPVT